MTTALSDEQSHEYAIPVFTGFAQGVRQVTLEPGQTINAKNMVIDDGNLEVMSGYTKYVNPTLPGGIKTLMVFYRTNDDASVTAFLLATTSTGIYKYNSTTLAWDNIFTGAHSGIYDYINYQTGMTDLIIAGNGVDATLKWDGSTATFVHLEGGAPKMGSLALHYERVWGVGDKNNPNRLYYSQSFAPEIWDFTEEQGAGFFEIPTWDGGKCIGIGVVADEVIVFKTRNIFRFVGTYPGEYAKYNVFSTTGAIAERSIANNKANAFFLAQDGIYVYNGNSAIKISSAVQTVIDSMTKNYDSMAAGVIFKDKYILAIPTDNSQVNNTIIEYDLNHQTFIVKRGINANTFVEYNDKLLFAGDTLVDGKCYVYEYNQGSDLFGTEIEAYWETPDTDWGAPNAKKVCSYVYFTAKGTGSIKIDAIFNEKGIIKTASTTKALTETDKIYKVRLRNKGRRFKFKFSNVSGSHFKISGIKIMLDVDED